MIIELNIGLHIQGRINNETQYSKRSAVALLKLGHLVVDSQRFVTQYQGPTGYVTEPGLFVALQTNNLFDAQTVVYELAIQLEQDCIGVYCPQTDSGSLVGPQSENWGSFQLAFFKRFSAQPERLAA